jgi:hypothetical protein
MHSDAIPSVIVGVHSLTLDGLKRDPLGVQSEHSPERKADSTLISLINERRKLASERFYKYLAVLLLDKQVANDPRIDERIQALKKACNVTFFIITSPMTEQELVKKK